MEKKMEATMVPNIESWRIEWKRKWKMKWKLGLYGGYRYRISDSGFRASGSGRCHGLVMLVWGL